MRFDRLKAVVLTLMTIAISGTALAHNYPTTTLADYVFGCMASNGQTREALERCSCSIDVIASVVPYDRYVQAETILRMRQVSGEKSVIFKEGTEYKKIVDQLRGAQVEAEIRCF